MTTFIEDAAVRAAEAIIDKVRTPPAGIVPCRENRLLNSQRITDFNVTNDRVTWTLTFTAEHGEILNRLRIIRPVRAQALRWQQNGEVIFAKSIDNEQYFRWFDDRWLAWVRNEVLC